MISFEQGKAIFVENSLEYSLSLIHISEPTRH